LNFNFLRKGKINLILFTFLLFFLSFFLVNALDVYDNSNLNEVTGVNIKKPETPINYSLIPTVNSSEYTNCWSTAEGVVCDIVDILHSDLSNLAWSVAGHTMDTILDMNDNNIQEINQAWFGSTFLHSDDSEHLDIHADYIDLHGNLSTIWDVYIQGDGDGPGGTSHGELIFGSHDAYVYYNGTDLIIDPDAIGTGDVVILGDIRADNFIGNFSGFFDGVNISNLSNMYTYYSDEIWINKNTSNAFVFNDSNLVGEKWYFFEETLVSGTALGTLEETRQYDDYDDVSYNLTEAVPSGLEYYANTSSNVSTDVNKICIRYIATGDDFDVSIWDISLDDWEGYMALTPNTDFSWKCVDIRDSADHLVDDKIMMKIVNAYSASTQHKLYIDAMYVSSGYTPRVGNEADPKFGAWLLNPIFTNNINATNVNFTIGEINASRNITGKYFIGDGSYLTGITATELDPNWFANWTNTFQFLVWNETYYRTDNATYDNYAYNVSLNYTKIIEDTWWFDFTRTDNSSYRLETNNTFIGDLNVTGDANIGGDVEVNGTIGIGKAPNSNYGIIIEGDKTAAFQGIFVHPVFKPASADLGIGGMTFYPELKNSAYNVASFRGVGGNLLINLDSGYTGTVTEAIGVASSMALVGNVAGDDPVVTNAYLFYAGPMTTNALATNLPTNAYGLYMVNMANKGTALSYAIYTGTGLNHFGDDVEIIGDLNVTGNITANQFYGEMWFNSHTTGVRSSILTQGVPVNVSGFKLGTETGVDLNGFVFDTENEWLSCKVAGKYQSNYQLSFGNTGNNQEYIIVLAVNNVLQNKTATHRKIGASGDVGNTAGLGYLDLNIGDNVSMSVINVDGTDDIISHSGSVNLIRIGS